MRGFVLLALLLFAAPAHAASVAYPDIAYGDGPRRMMDIYTPQSAAAGPYPVVLFFHGGSWQWGRKEEYKRLGEVLADEGFVTIIANYRLYPAVTFPAFIEDAANALRFVHDRIASYGGNPDRIFVMGQSAGAHIALLLALDDRYIRQAGGSLSWIKGTIGIAGPYNVMPSTIDAQTRQKLFGTAKREVDIYPFSFAMGIHAPVLLMTGNNDDIVPHYTSEHLAAKLAAEGTPVTLRIYPGANHQQTLIDLVYTPPAQSPLLQDLLAFLRQ